MRYCVTSEYRQIGQDGSNGTIVPSGYYLKCLHAVRILTNGPADETTCGQSYANIRTDVDWEDVRANTVNAPRCESCKKETGF